MTGSDRALERVSRLHPKVIDLTLGRIERLLAALGHPEARLPPVIHVAGTNGKGSTVAMIRAGLEATGARVHVYTSPHLARFHERIRISGELVDEDRLIALIEACEAANGPEPITFFEVTTAAALLAFAEEPADYTLLEVGLGGRLDATNVVARPRLTVITPVSIDHQQYLGETLAEIASKAGILKRGVPCVVGPQQAAAWDVIVERADTVGAPLIAEGQDWQVWEEHGRLAFQDMTGLLDLPRPALIGAHQVSNAGAALAALRALGVNESACEVALTRAVWPARLQRLRHGPLVAAAGPAAELWLDGGHNAAAGLALAEALTRLPARPLHLVVGMLGTKDVGGFLRPLGELAASLQGVSIPGEAATLSAEDTVAAAKAVGIAAEPAPDLATAIARIASRAPEARILICGSLYLAGRVLSDNG